MKKRVAQAAEAPAEAVSKVKSPTTAKPAATLATRSPNRPTQP